MEDEEVVRRKNRYHRLAAWRRKEVTYFRKHGTFIGTFKCKVTAWRQLKIFYCVSVWQIQGRIYEVRIC